MLCCTSVLPCSEAEKLEIAEEEGRNNDVWAGMEADDPELQAALIRAGGWFLSRANVVAVAAVNCPHPLWTIPPDGKGNADLQPTGALSNKAADTHCIIIVNSMGIIQVSAALLQQCGSQPALPAVCVANRCHTSE
jgi:hypothetical protein